MEVIPLITIKKHKLYINNNEKPITHQELQNHLKDQTEIYFLDLDGINKDKPNLCTFQKLSPRYDIWVDAGPRTIGDVVDLLMAGCTRMTIKNSLIKKEDLLKIKDLTENKIYLSLDPSEKYSSALPQGIEGYVAISQGSSIDKNFELRDMYKTATYSNTVYAVEPNIENLPFWEKLNIKGIIVNIKQIDKVKEKWTHNQEL